MEDELNVRLGGYCSVCLYNPCQCKLNLYLVTNNDLCEGNVRHTCKHFEKYVGCENCPIKKYEHE